MHVCTLTIQRWKFRRWMLHVMNIADVICYILAGFKFSVRVYISTFRTNCTNFPGWHSRAETCRSGERAKFYVCF